MKIYLFALLFMMGFVQLQSQSVVSFDNYIKTLEQNGDEASQILLKEIGLIFKGAETTAFIKPKEYKILGSGTVRILEGKPEGFNTLTPDNPDFSHARYAVIHIERIHDLSQLSTSVLQSVPSLTHIIFISDVELDKTAFATMAGKMTGITVLYKISIPS